MALANTPAIPELVEELVLRRSCSGTSFLFLSRVFAAAKSLAVNGRPPSSLEVDMFLSGGGGFLAAKAAGLGEGGALGGGGGGVGTPTGGGGGGGGAPPLPFITGAGGPLTTGRGGGGGGRAPADDPAGSFAGRGGMFDFDLGGCLIGKSSYSTIFFLDLMFDAGGIVFAGGDGLLGFGGKGGSGLSASGATSTGGGELSFGGRGGMLMLPLVCLCGSCGKAFSGSFGGSEGMAPLPLFLAGDGSPPGTGTGPRRLKLGLRPT